MRTQISKNNPRTEEQLREHYEIEKELAAKLLNASKEERQTLYSAVYEELFRRVPLHPQLTKKQFPEQQREIIARKMKLLRRFLDKEVSFVEVGAGDCALTFEVAKHVRQTYAIDVSETVTRAAEVPENYQLILSDGTSVPVPEEGVDFVYSNHLMEHLHPDDALDQLQNIYRALAPGGLYLCLTPNRMNGPHDISEYFDSVATGLHLKEYTVTELNKLFKQAGFAKVIMYIGGKELFFRSPVYPSIWCEQFLKLLPHKLRHKLANALLVQAWINIRLLGIKGKK